MKRHHKIIFCLLFFASSFATNSTSTKEFTTQASSIQKPMTDEERTDHIENTIKTSFAKIFSGIINALQNPKEKAKHVADCINAMLNIIWEATRDKKAGELEEVLKIVDEICNAIEDQEVANEIKKIIKEHQDEKTAQGK